MKTFNKTLIAATTIATFGLAAAPTALALDASASVATTYLFRGVEMNSGSAQVSVDVSGSANGLTYGVWVASGDSLNEYDLYLDYSGSLGSIGYSIGYVDYNYSAPRNSLYDTGVVETALVLAGETDDAVYDDALDADAGFEESYIGLSYGPISVTYFNMQDSDADYTTIGYDLGALSLTYGSTDFGEDGADDFDHVDLSYAVNDSVSLTVSKADDLDAVVAASYTVSF